MARTMLKTHDTATHFWAEAINTACHIINRVYFKPKTFQTAYEVWRGRKPNVKYFHIFGSICYVLNDRDQRRKLDDKGIEAIFLGYSKNSRAFRVYNKTSGTVIESINVVFEDGSKTNEDEDFAAPVPPSGPDRQEVTTSQKDGDDSASEPEENVSKTNKKVAKNHPTSDIIGDVEETRRTRGKKIDFLKMVSHLAYTCYISNIEPKSIKEALTIEDWVGAMQEELQQFERCKVWTLVPKPENVNIIGTKWIYRNKTDEHGNITRNKARLVAQGFSQIEGVDYEETFAPVTRLESVRLLLAMACHLKFKLYQMDVKSAFLNGDLEEEAYVSQPKGFEDPKHPDHVFKLRKALYGLKQAPRAWYDTLSVFLLSKGYTRGGSDKTLFYKREQGHVILIQIYVDDIIFGSQSSKLVKDFVNFMTSEYDMSMFGELHYFLGLQIQQKEDGIFINQTKYAKNLITKFEMNSSKPKRTPISTSVKLSKDEDGKAVEQSLYRSLIGSLLYLTASRPDICHSVGVCARYQSCPKESHLVAVKNIIRYIKGTCDFGLWFSKDTSSTLLGYTDADWAGCPDDRKSTSGGCFYLGNNLVSWHSKKQNCISLSSTEAEYIAAGSACTQLIWMSQMLEDYGEKTNTLTLLCDNKSAIDITKNPVLHSRTKHIAIRHHFIRDMVERKTLNLEFVTTEKQLADVFTKALDAERFESLRAALGLCIVQ